MDELSEREQWDLLKGWLRSNGPQVLILVAIMLVGWYGWKWWQGRGEQQALAQSAAYDAIIAKFDDLKYAEGEALIETLRSEHPDSPYVASADMIAARVFVESNQLDKAAQRLENVSSTAKDKRLRPIALIRLARVQAAQGNYDKALATISTPLGVQEAARLEARGDILQFKGDHAAALAEYAAARQLAPAAVDTAGGEGSATELLELKIADLKGSAAAAPAAPASVTKPEAAPAVAKP